MASPNSATERNRTGHDPWRPPSTMDFERAFDVKAMRVLSLVSLFRTYVNSFTVQLMCRPITDKKAVGMPDHDLSWTIPGLEDETQVSIEVVLDKAVEMGVLRKSEDHNYWLHPAIRLHLQPFFEKSYPTPEQRAVAGRAYAEARAGSAFNSPGVLQKGARARVVEALDQRRRQLERQGFIPAGHANGWRAGGNWILPTGSTPTRAIRGALSNGACCFPKCGRTSSVPIWSLYRDAELW